MARPLVPRSSLCSIPFVSIALCDTCFHIVFTFPSQATFVWVSANMWLVDSREYSNVFVWLSSSVESLVLVRFAVDVQ